ncbi:hypothetical protein CR513_33560, partial [Mucuna pruriens]
MRETCLMNILYFEKASRKLYLFDYKPDIMYAVQQLQFVALFNTRGLCFPTSSSPLLTTYCDADGRFWSVKGDALIAWKCKKKDLVSKSSIEAENRVMFSAFSEI